MPWKERSIVEERMRFVLRLKDGESMASLCREFGISRVTAYKIYVLEVVGAKGFEPSTSWSRTRRASQAALRPDEIESASRITQQSALIHHRIAIALQTAKKRNAAELNFGSAAFLTGVKDLRTRNAMRTALRVGW